MLEFLIVVLSSAVFGGLSGLIVGILYTDSRLGILAGGCAALLAFLWLHAWWRSVVAHDHGIQPAPTAPAQLHEANTTIRVVAANGLAGDVLRFGLPPEKLRVLAAGLANGEPITQARWQGLLTRPELARLLAELIQFGYAVWRSPGTPARGAVLTAKGRALCRQLGAPLPQGQTQGRF